MLERLMERYPQLRVVVQRPSTIIRQGDDAETDEAGLDWVNSLLHYAHKTRTVPRVEYNAGAFDLVSIETCCDDVIRELLRDTAKSPAKTDKGITFVNNVGDIIIPMSSMAEIGLRQTGKKYEVRPMEDWTRAVVAAGMHPAVAALIETFDEPGVDKYPRLLREVEA